MDQTPTPPSTGAGTHSTMFALLFAAYGGTIALAWGLETHACQGIVAGALAAIMRTTFLALTHPPELLRLLMVFAAHLGLAYLVARRRPFRGREVLLTMLMPMASFLVGLLVADLAWVDSRCAMHPWR